jgi:hypothetical protein
MMAFLIGSPAGSLTTLPSKHACEDSFPEAGVWPAAIPASTAKHTNLTANFMQSIAGRL